MAVSIICPGYVRTSLSLNAVVADGAKYGQMDETTAKVSCLSRIWGVGAQRLSTAHPFMGFRTAMRRGTWCITGCRSCLRFNLTKICSGNAARKGRTLALAPFFPRDTDKRPISWPAFAAPVCLAIHARPDWFQTAMRDKCVIVRAAGGWADGRMLRLLRRPVMYAWAVADSLALR